MELQRRAGAVVRVVVEEGGLAGAHRREPLHDAARHDHAHHEDGREVDDLLLDEAEAARLARLAAQRARPRDQRAQLLEHADEAEEARHLQHAHHPQDREALRRRVLLEHAARRVEGGDLDVHRDHRELVDEREAREDVAEPVLRHREHQHVIEDEDRLHRHLGRDEPDRRRHVLRQVRLVHEERARQQREERVQRDQQQPDRAPAHPREQPLAPRHVQPPRRRREQRDVAERRRDVRDRERDVEHVDGGVAVAHGERECYSRVLREAEPARYECSTPTRLTFAPALRSRATRLAVNTLF